MASNHQKGTGAYTAPHLSIRQKLILGDWAKEHAEECQTLTYGELAAKASADPAVGFPVTQSNMSSVCRARFGKRVVIRASTASMDTEARLDDIDARLHQIGERLAKLERFAEEWK